MINKPVATQSIWSSVHVYQDGTVRCTGTHSDERQSYTDWTVQEKAVIHKAVALIAGKLGGFEDGDQEKIETALDTTIAELAPKEVETKP